VSHGPFGKLSSRSRNSIIFVRLFPQARASAVDHTHTHTHTCTHTHSHTHTHTHAQVSIDGSSGAESSTHRSVRWQRLTSAARLWTRGSCNAPATPGPPPPPPSRLSYTPPNTIIVKLGTCRTLTIAHAHAKPHTHA
jgi:hypothetical protein